MRSDYKHDFRTVRVSDDPDTWMKSDSKRHIPTNVEIVTDRGSLRQPFVIFVFYVVKYIPLYRLTQTPQL